MRPLFREVLTNLNNLTLNKYMFLFAKGTNIEARLCAKIENETVDIFSITCFSKMRQPMSKKLSELIHICQFISWMRDFTFDDRTLANHDLWWEDRIKLCRTRYSLINVMAKSVRRVYHASRADTLDRTFLVNTKKANK